MIPVFSITTLCPQNFLKQLEKFLNGKRTRSIRIDCFPSNFEQFLLHHLNTLVVRKKVCFEVSYYKVGPSGNRCSYNTCIRTPQQQLLPTHPSKTTTTATTTATPISDRSKRLGASSITRLNRVIRGTRRL